MRIDKVAEVRMEDRMAVRIEETRLRGRRGGFIIKKGLRKEPHGKQEEQMSRRT